MPRSLLPEYSHAARELFAKAVNVFMRAQNPVLAGMGEEQVSHLPQESAPRDAAVGDLHSFESVKFEGVLDQEYVFTVDTEQWVSAAWSAAERALHKLMPQLYASMDIMAQRNNMFAAGKVEDFTWDRLIDTVEKMSVSFNEQGQVDLQLVLPPALAQFAAENPLNEKQLQRWNEVMEQKRRDADARRRHRRLA